MKRLMLPILLAISCMFSCGKSKEAGPAAGKPSSTVRIRLAGDILINESPLPNGRKVQGAQQYAKGLRDSTLYGVIVSFASIYGRFSSGLFNNRDSIVVDLPEGEFDISVIAFKRGSGPGLYYEWQDGVPYYGDPINSSLTNSMYGPKWGQMRDTLYKMQLFDPLDSTKSLPLEFIAEVDGYRGRKVVAVAETPSVITLEMKRMAFGVQFSAENFTEGKLHAEFIDNFGNGDILPKTVTPENIGEHFIYTLHSFIGQEDTYSYLLNVRITWEKADGTMVPLGQKAVYFKRNVLTHIHITIPETGRTSSGNAVLSYSEEPLR